MTTMLTQHNVNRFGTGYLMTTDEIVLGHLFHGN